MSGHPIVRSRSRDLSSPGNARRVVAVAIASPLDAELVASIRAIGDHVSVLYQPELLPPTRYPGDHRGVDRFRRDPDAESRWQEMLRQAEVRFGIPGDSPAGLAVAVRGNPRLRWVQGTAAGTGEQLKAAGPTQKELERVTVTSASGVHVRPLAEFCLLGLLALTKGLPQLQVAQRAHHWDHYPVAEPRGATALVLGLGSIGTVVARLAKAPCLSTRTSGSSSCSRPMTRSTWASPTARPNDGHTAHQSVEHDDLNVLCPGARVIGPELAKNDNAERIRAPAKEIEA